MTDRITGQIVLRDKGTAPDHKRRLFMVVGIIAVPKEALLLRGEHQYIVAGNAAGRSVCCPSSPALI